jgi:hypothetical protein
MTATQTQNIFIEAVGLAAPGLANWQAALPILQGQQAYESTPLQPHSPLLLPPNERRRATPTVRLAFQAAEDAVQGSSIAAAELATVFTSSDADLNIIHRICTALAATPRMISPTEFHNSVHNAAAGYWSIAVGSRAPSTTLSAHDYSFAAGLAEACGCVQVDGLNTLLVAFDLPPPEPIYAKRPIAQPVGVALVLTRERTAKSLASLRCVPTADPQTVLKTPGLEALRVSNPAARALPLLSLLALRHSGSVILPRAENAGLLVELRMV